MSQSTDKSLQSLAARGQSLATHAARADMDIYMQASQDIYHPATNPEGKFPLNMAENGPMIPHIRARLAEILQQSAPPAWTFQYTDTTGHPEVRATLAQFMEKYLCLCPIDPAHLGMSAGASAIIEVSSFLLANPGEVVAIPAPSYPMYTHDMGVKSGLQRYDLQTHIELSEHGIQGPVTADLLDQALTDINAQGKTLKMLVITTPDNPTGCVYTAPQLRALAQWCVTHQVHMVVNEIYGLSRLEQEGIQDTVSFAQIMYELDSEYLHMWYALSKDFAMSGMRVGIVHSRNASFMAGFANANIPHMVSNLTQWVIGELLADNAFLGTYVRQNQEHLAHSYKVVTDALEKLNIPYLPASGSLFIWADFSQFLPEDSNTGQHTLWLDIYQHTGVLLTPGDGFQHQKKGLFRIVHTGIPTEWLEVAMNRMVGYLGTS